MGQVIGPTGLGLGPTFGRSSRPPTPPRRALRTCDGCGQDYSPTGSRQILCLTCRMPPAPVPPPGTLSVVWAPGYTVGPDGSVWSIRGRTLRRLCPTLNARGVPSVLLQVGGQAKRAMVARLVADLFLPPAPPGSSPKSYDGNPMNCAASNLVWIFTRRVRAR
jgi:hypothetical protein